MSTDFCRQNSIENQMSLQAQSDYVQKKSQIGAHSVMESLEDK